MHFALELIGTIAFAISGAMVGVTKKMDILGVVVLGMTTAVGGGIIRDLLIGNVPPNAFKDPVYALVALGVSLIVFFPFVRKRIDVDSAFLVIIDALGLGVFTVTGVSMGMRFDNLFLQVFLGVMTGVGGGVLRDIFADDTPAIFVRHFYAIASLIGAIVCAILFSLAGEDIAMISGAVIIIVLRLLAAGYKWNLPKVR